MSILERIFGRSERPRDIDAEIAKLEAEAEQAQPGYVGTAFNRAGDLALKDDQGDRAVSYYGRAIDAFLEDGQREMARGVANKILRVRPTAIRTLCTMTWLDLAAQHQATALLHLRDYVSAALDGGFGTRAATQVHAMARVCPDPEFVQAAGDALDQLGFPKRAREVRTWVSSDGSPDAITERAGLAEACLEAAVRSNDPDVDLLVDGSDDEGDEGDGDDKTDDAQEAQTSDRPDAEVDPASEEEPATDGDEDKESLGEEESDERVAVEQHASEAAPEAEAEEDGDPHSDEPEGETGAGGSEKGGEEPAPAAAGGGSSRSRKSRKKRRRRGKKKRKG